ncbi:MAG: DUF4157 domain-containing protein [Terriglobia bacterium]
MSKQAATQAKQSLAPGFTRARSSLLERYNTLGPHLCIQREAMGPAVHPSAPTLVRDVVESPGRPLDAATRSFMEPRFGYDLSQIRVHTDDRAAESAQAVRANAYTAGTHVAFGTGQYAPGTPGGQRLLAHELTHVVQQASGRVASTPIADRLSVSDPSDRFEQAARENSAAAIAAPNNDPKVVSGLPTLPAAATSESDTLLQRQQEGPAAFTGAIAGGFSAVFAGIGLIPAFESAAAGKRQAAEAEKQTKIAQANLDVAKEALAVADNPPVPAPTTGGIVVNNGAGYADISPSKLPKGVEAGEGKEVPLTLLKVSQGANDFANFNAVVKTDGKNITGGYLQDGPAQGYLGGSAGSNLSLSLKPVEGPAIPQVAPGGKTKGKPRPIASVRFLISGNNIAPRTPPAGASQIQRFSGSVSVSAAGDVVASKPFSATPGTMTPGDGVSRPAVAIDLPPSQPAPTPPPIPAPAKKKATGGGTPAPGGGAK